VFFLVDGQYQPIEGFFPVHYNTYEECQEALSAAGDYLTDNAPVDFHLGCYGIIEEYQEPTY